MSRDLDKSENATFSSLYGAGKCCEKCNGSNLTIRIWEAYASPAKQVGGDIGPQNIVGAVVICDDCGHGQTVSRDQITGTPQAA